MKKPKLKKRKCKTKYCKNSVNVGTKCRTCTSRDYRSKHPVMAAYSNAKSNAKRRGKIFTLTYDYYKEFCIETNYIAGKGRTKESYSIDCIDPRLGYVPGNIQILTVQDNSRKSNRLVYDWQTKTATVIRSSEIDKSKNIF